MDDGDQHDVALAGDLRSGRSHSRHAFQSLGRILPHIIYRRQHTGTGETQSHAASNMSQPDHPSVRHYFILCIVSISSLAALRETRSEEHTSELPSLMRISYADLPLKKKKQY